MKKQMMVFLLSFFLATFPLSFALAIMDGFSIPDLSAQSDVVVMGRVMNVTSHWSQDGKRIMSTANIWVDEVVRGTGRHGSEKVVTVEYEGGEIGDVGYRVSDAVILNAGENIVVFLQASAGASGSRRIQSESYGAGSGMPYTVMGRAQGVYKISDDGIARKEGFTVASRRDAVVNNIPAVDLLRMIREVRQP